MNVAVSNGSSRQLDPFASEEKQRERIIEALRARVERDQENR